MNRAQRRAYANMSKSKKQEFDRIANKINKLENKLEEYEKDKEDIRGFVKTPSFYIDDKPIIEGSVIFLKKDNSINYTPQLKFLVQSNHRFAIIVRLRQNPQKTVLVCLLSTSEVYNKDLEQGIRLHGNYSKYKDVYMDTTKCWIIPCDCIDRVNYTLTPKDSTVGTCKLVSPYFNKPKLIKGIYDDKNINNDYSEYSMILDQRDSSVFSATRNNLDQWLITDYISSLSLDEVKELIDVNVTSDMKADIMWRIKRNVLRENFNLDLNDEDEISRCLLMNAIMKDSDLRKNIVKSLILNY